MISLKDPKVQLTLVTLILLAMGLMFVYSAGSLQGIRIGKGDMYFFTKQSISMLVGLVALFAAYNIPLDFYRKHVVLLYFVTLVLLVGVFFQNSINGAHRWINLPVFSFQPSEVAKFTVVVYLAYYLDKKYDRMADFYRGFLPAMILVGVLAALVIIEPDFGTTFLIMLVAFTLFFVGGVRARHILGIAGFVAPIFIAGLFFGYRKGRLLMFLDPWADRFGSGYQLVQSLAAVGSGGFFGKGLGASTQKLFFLPEAHTDFVFAIIAEELGFLGAMFVLVAIIMFFRIAIKQALRHTDRYKKLLMIGITCLLFFQSMINICVVVGLMPTKGITLPFISYGGSALMMSLFFVGILLRGIEEAG